MEHAIVGTMTDAETKVVAAWREAGAELGIRFTSPFTSITPGGQRQEYLGLVHQFGSKYGALVAVLNEPSENKALPAGDNYFWSVLSPVNYGQYDRQLFVDTPNDWQFFGSDLERPSWYSGKSWT